MTIQPTRDRNQTLTACLMFLVSWCSTSLILGADERNESVRLRVFQLFRIQHLRWSCPGGAWVEVYTGNSPRTLRLEPEDFLDIRLPGSRLQVTHHRGPEISSVLEVAGKLQLNCAGGNAVPEFLLAIPGRIQRYFRGTLQVSIANGFLQPILLTHAEQLAADVAGAEMSGVKDSAALEAQVIVARSFIATHRYRHHREGYDFCDTTHCQFTKGSRVSKAHQDAAEATRGLTVTYRGSVIPAFYSAVCEGQVHTLPGNLSIDTNYPRRRVDCPFCAEAKQNARGSVRVVSPFSGAANGHGIGLCQAGALDMARRGFSASEILGIFFPGTELRPLPVGR